MSCSPSAEYGISFDAPLLPLVRSYPTGRPAKSTSLSPSNTRSSQGSSSSYERIGSSSNVRPRRYAQCALRASIDESHSDIDPLLEQLQRQRLHVVRLNLAEADKFVAVTVPRIALHEE